MYSDISFVDGKTLYQGDIISDFPFPILDGTKQIKKNDITGSFELNEELPIENKLLFAVESKVQAVMILSQSCDLQRRSNVIICPIYNLEEFVADNTIKSDTVKSIKKREINYLFYLPQYNLLPESIGDLQTMVYVPRAQIESYIQKRISSLSDLGRHHLSWSLANYFGRPAVS